jgi:hypothetical protein
MEVPVPEMEVETEEEEKESEYSVTEKPRAKPLLKADRTEGSYTAEQPEPPPLPIDEPRRKRRKKRRPKNEAGWSIPSIAVSPTIITGILMMVGAVVWFIAGLFVGFIFFYPPILFVLGLAAVVRGAMGHED